MSAIKDIVGAALAVVVAVALAGPGVAGSWAPPPPVNGKFDYQGSGATIPCRPV